MKMLSLETVADLRHAVAAWRSEGQSVGFVPTMGALHAGHLSLVESAKAVCGRVVASIFVNPTQFGPGEDFERYPRTLEADRALLESAGADALYLPSVAEMYPAGFATTVHVAGVSEGLCGASRPGHFDGVATVVAKLFAQVQPDRAFFGEKDYQQLQVIRRMVADLNLPVVVEGCLTVREADGLALSSRNRYLSAEDRAIAPALYRTLRDTAAALRSGMSVALALDEGIRALTAAGFSSVEYLELRSDATLQPLDTFREGARLLAAVRLVTTRLIDNIEA